jgi:hypothetical protein
LPALTLSFVCCSDTSRVSFANQVNEAIARSSASEEGLCDSQSDEDVDDWLAINANDFDDMLEQTMAKGRGANTKRMDVAMADSQTDVDGDGLASGAGEEERAQQQASRLQDLAKKVGDFVEGKGDLEGARFTECVLIVPNKITSMLTNMAHLTVTLLPIRMTRITQ